MRPGNADVVIGDYNYVASPSATVQRFFGTPEESSRNLVLFDEAHNLPGPGRGLVLARARDRPSWRPCARLGGGRARPPCGPGSPASSGAA